MPRDGELDHLAARLRGRDRGLQLVRRLRGGDEPDLIQTALFATLLRQRQMAVMNRIERAAVNAESHGLTFHFLLEFRIHSGLMTSGPIMAGVGAFRGLHAPYDSSFIRAVC